MSPDKATRPLDPKSRFRLRVRSRERNGSEETKRGKESSEEIFFPRCSLCLDDSPAVSRGGGVSNVEPLFAAALINSARYLRAQKGAATSAWKWSSAGEGEGRRTEDAWEKIDSSERETGSLEFWKKKSQ